MKWWKTIENFENYEVCYAGLVRNKITKRILKLEKCKGYLRVSLSNNGKVKRFLVHRLVAIYFLENPKNKKCVNHKNGDKEFNHYLNLEWNTYSENEMHSYNVLGKINSQRKLNEFQVKDIIENCIKADRKNIYLFPGNVYSFMVKYNVDRKTILNILNKKYYV